MKNIVVTFHNITNQEWFENTLNILDKFYKFGPLSQLEECFEKKTHGYCFITFDDGEKSFYDLAYPILLKKAIPVALFVSPKAIIDKKNFWFQDLRNVDTSEMKNAIVEAGLFDKQIINLVSLLPLLKSLKIENIDHLFSEYKKRVSRALPSYQNITKEELLELSTSHIVTIGAHTINHPILHNESATTSSYEIIQSIEQLSTLLQREIKYFAYPNGIFDLDYSNREVEILKSTSVKLAFTTDVGKVNISESKYKINRIGLTTGSSFHILIKIFFGKSWDLTKRNIKGSKDERKQRSFLKNYVNNQ